jgi:hypothetical protein
MATQVTTQVRREVTVNGRTIGTTESVSANAGGFFDEDVADGQTDSVINLAIDVSAVKSFLVVSDRNVALETNDGAAPSNTINLVANKPYVFVTGDYIAFLLTVDVTKFLITNASGASANVRCEFSYDPTPS